MESRTIVPVLGVILILLMSLPMNLNSAVEPDQTISPVIEQVDNGMISYTPHAAISTHLDAPLYNLAIADGWPGYGNSTHPWIIEGYSFSAGTCISIGFTSYIFTIRNCLMVGTNPSSGYGIRILGTDYTNIENCIVSGAGEGIEFYDVRSSTIRNCTTYGCGNFGMYMRYATGSNIYDSEIRDNTQVGINIRDSASMTLENNTIFGNGYEGIFVDHDTGWDSDYLTLHNNTIRNNGGSSYPGLNIWDTDYVTATSMYIHDNYDGVLVQDSHGFSISDSYVYDNLESGIEIRSSSNCEISHNMIYDNLDYGVYVNSTDSGTLENNTIRESGHTGFYLGYSDDWTATENLVHDNVGHGFDLYEVNSSLLYYNDIGWNGLSNANDTGSGTNDWNTAVTGNWWHDHIGGIYDIPGGSFDYFPSYCLVGVSNGPLDIQWESIGVQLTWSANALNPVSYMAYRNESIVGSGVWNGSNIVVDVNATILGYYEYTLIAYHISGHNTTRTTSVTIGDWLAPNWDFTPQDILLLAGGDLFYQLMASDQSAIGGWTVNNTVNFSISASGLLTNTVALSAGEFGLNVSVYDIYGNTQSIIIRIIILAEIPVTTTPAANTTTTTITVDVGYLMSVSGLIGAVGGMLFVGVIIILQRVRGRKPE